MREPPPDGPAAPASRAPRKVKTPRKSSKPVKYRPVQGCDLGTRRTDSDGEEPFETGGDPDGDIGRAEGDALRTFGSSGPDSWQQQLQHEAKAPISAPPVANTFVTAPFAAWVEPRSGSLQLPDAKSPIPAQPLPRRLEQHKGQHGPSFSGPSATKRARLGHVELNPTIPSMVVAAEASSSTSSCTAGCADTCDSKAVQHSRRLLANARERTRVHTISAAFEALRTQVPCYSYGQKLSKLAILRIACSYILALAKLANRDYSGEPEGLTFAECVEQCTRTLQAEGRAKKRKE
uniref:Protein atonal homolog 8 n=1 Tax=Eptatretus burgeri TaxID=7764 RepID=A0A8C4WVM8_EPTBU